MENQLPIRKPNRIEEYDYSQNGAYFITICTQDRKKILSKITVGTGVLDCPHIELLPHGEIADKYIRQLNDFYDHISVDQYAIMPDHIHILVDISAKNSLSDFVKKIKQESSYLIARHPDVRLWDGWEEGYSAFTYSAKDIKTVTEYIINQKEHHKRVSFIDEYRAWLIEMGVSPDEPYFPKLD